MFQCVLTAVQVARGTNMKTSNLGHCRGCCLVGQPSLLGKSQVRGPISNSLEISWTEPWNTREVVLRPQQAHTLAPTRTRMHTYKNKYIKINMNKPSSSEYVCPLKKKLGWVNCESVPTGNQRKEFFTPLLPLSCKDKIFRNKVKHTKVNI